ncbi:MAG TPA: hypothetical protein VKK79_06685 [Candidatus Lokiarchaeia archaeon]|nr:hypothetical protein [Candidatus Lokiarchaeia archaeon]
MDDHSSDTLDDIVRKEFERGLQGEGIAKYEQTDWVDYFGYEKDPFQPQPEDTLETFYDRVAQVQYFANLIGYQRKSGLFYHVALVGARGHGKGTLLLAIHKAMQRNAAEGGKVINLTTGTNLETGEDIGEHFLRSRDFRDCPYLFLIDCKYNDQLKLWLNTCSQAEKLVVTSWRPFHYALAWRKFSEISAFAKPNKEIILPPLASKDLVALIEKRVRFYGREKSPLSDPEVYAAASYAHGNIITLMYILKQAHQLAMTSDHRQVLRTDLERAIENLGISPEPIALSPKETNLLLVLIEWDIARRRIAPKDVARSLDWDSALTWRYFRRLVSLKILRKEGYQKGARYVLNEEGVSLAEQAFLREFMTQKIANPLDSILNEEPKEEPQEEGEPE